MLIKDKKTKEIVYQGKSTPEELFQIPMVTSSRGSQFTIKNPEAYLGKVVKNSIWHKRLRHPTHDIVAIMLNQPNISAQIDDTHSTCISCIKGKMSSTPFPFRTYRCTFPFEKVHIDIWGLLL